MVETLSVLPQTLGRAEKKPIRWSDFRSGFQAKVVLRSEFVEITRNRVLKRVSL